MVTRAVAYDTEADDALIALLTLESEGTTLRVTDWDENIVSNGITYRAVAFRLTMPAATDEAPPVARIRVDNATLDFISAIRSITETILATIAVVSFTDQDTIEIGPMLFECRVSQYDMSTADLDLTFEPILAMAVPYLRFTPGLAPGIFRTG